MKIRLNNLTLLLQFLINLHMPDATNVFVLFFSVFSFLPLISLKQIFFRGKNLIITAPLAFLIIFDLISIFLISLHFFYVRPNKTYDWGNVVWEKSGASQGFAPAILELIVCHKPSGKIKFLFFLLYILYRVCFIRVFVW